MGIVLQGGPHDSSVRTMLGQRHVPLGAEAPTRWVGKQAAGHTHSELAVRRPGKAPEEAVPIPSPGRHAATPLSPRKQLEQSADSRRVRDWDPRAQPSEPILFPRLRIHFADFPLPTLFHRPEAVHLGDLMRVMSTTRAWEALGLRVFSRAAGGAPDTRATCGALPAAGPYLRAESIPGWAGC
ncbi:hypothetical protein L6452_46834 [Arctium lappa]|nr:hypothetical protein L6452_46834 [Arctium lappa]